MKVKTAVFWVIEGKIYTDMKIVEVTDDDRRNGFVDYPTGHFDAWDGTVGRLYPSADFATYPRGRLIYSLKDKHYVVYLDKCITAFERKCLIDRFHFGEKPYTFAYDEHYRCDKCLESDPIDFDEIPTGLQNLLNSEPTTHVHTPAEEPMPQELRATVLRGENELTGNLIEISNGVHTVLVECGISLDNTTNALTQLERSLIERRFDAIFVSHNHADHAGLIKRFSKSNIIYVGEKAKRAILLQKSNHRVSESALTVYSNGEPVYIGRINGCSETDGFEIKVTPFLCDHSVPDSYMLLFEYGGRKILYTGDFRAHGRKDFGALLSALPTKVDVLICEGTNEGKDKKIISEVAVQHLVEKRLASCVKPVFVLVPQHNIDRIVGLYKAAAKCERLFLVDDMQANVLEVYGGHVPRPSKFRSVRIYYPRGVDDCTFVKNNRAQSLGVKDVAEINNYAMIIKTSNLSYLKTLAAHREDGLRGSVLIYSMWSGYREEPNMKRFLSETESMGIETYTAHTSGHADKEAIEKLKARVNPNEIIRVHTRLTP